MIYPTITGVGLVAVHAFNSIKVIESVDVIISS